MFKKSIVKRICILFAMVMMISAICPTNVFAETFYSGHDYYLGSFHFVDSNQGSKRTYNANQMRIKVAWRYGETPRWDWVYSDIDLYVDVYRAWNGQSVYKHRFTPSEDWDGKDGDGYYYVESDWFNINNGSDYRIYYEAFTTPGKTGTGYNRQGDVHTWVELR